MSAHTQPPLPANVKAWLASLKAPGVSLGLERMGRLVRRLGDPQLRVPVVHVAGTNGKGSVAAMVEAALRQAGWRVGLYTSPHLVRLGERVQVNRVPIDNQALATRVEALRAVVEALTAAEGDATRPTYFEFMTALAFQTFAAEGCDIAVIECGLGGRLDATNVVMPEVSVITSIGFDHAELLGDTLAAIAGEKAGIIKPRRPVVIGRLPPEAEQVVRREAARRDAPLHAVRDAFGETVATYPPTRLAGGFQRLNAATARLALRALGARWRVTDAVAEAAFASVDWSARWQSLSVAGRRVIVDAAHNEEGAAALADNLAELVAATGRKPVVVVGVLGQVRAKPLLDAICRHAAELRLVVPAQRRACSFDELEACLPAGYNGRVVRTTVESLFPDAGVCDVDLPLDTPVVVTGSIYLAGEVLARLQPERGPFEPELQDF